MKSDARSHAEVLRRNGESVKEIARKLAVSQSTASRWCSSVPLSQSQKTFLIERRRAAGIKALEPWIRKNQALKQRDIGVQSKAGVKDLGKMSRRDLFMLGLGLYWGEGYKRGSQEWGFTNSDPAMIRIMVLWLQHYYDVSRDRIHARITINERYRAEAERLLTWWSKETEIPKDCFSPPTFISGYNAINRSSRDYYGTLRIKVRNGTSLRRRILASISAAQDYTSPNSRKTFS